MGQERTPRFTYGGKTRKPIVEDDDELSRTYTGLVALVDAEALSQKAPSKEVLNKMVEWMGAAKGRLLALTNAKVAERFPILDERVKNLRWMVYGQWAAILFLADRLFQK